MQKLYRKALLTLRHSKTDQEREGRWVASVQKEVRARKAAECLAEGARQCGGANFCHIETGGRASSRRSPTRELLSPKCRKFAAQEGRSAAWLCWFGQIVRRSCWERIFVSSCRTALPAEAGQYDGRSWVISVSTPCIPGTSSVMEAGLD